MTRRAHPLVLGALAAPLVLGSWLVRAEEPPSPPPAARGEVLWRYETGG